MENNDNLMPFAGKFDCDPADCNDAESAADYNVTEDETDYEVTEDGINTENKQSHNSEQSDDYGATYSVDPSYGVDKLDTESGAETNLDALYVEESDFDTETEGDGYGSHGGVCENPSTTEINETVDPSDETAATCDCDFDPTTKAQKHCSLDDYEIISDVLGAEKQLVKLYSTALCESAEEPLRDIFRENLIECAKDQYETFEYMSTRGLYKTEQADDNKILEAKQKFCPIDCGDDCDCGCK